MWWGNNNRNEKRQEDQVLYQLRDGVLGDSMGLICKYCGRKIGTYPFKIDVCWRCFPRFNHEFYERWKRYYHKHYVKR